MSISDFTIPLIKNDSIQSQVQAQLDDLTKPPGSLGFLEDLVMQYCLCRNDSKANLRSKELFVFAASHGITAEGVAPYPKEVTVQMVMNMLGGGAAVTVMSRQANMSYNVVDMGVDGDFDAHELLSHCKVAHGTVSFLSESAMTEKQCDQALQTGINLSRQVQSDIVAIGEMGIGNTSSASALYSLLFGKSALETVGRGTGSEGELLEKKRQTLDRAISFHRANWDGTAFDALQRVGGFEIAGMTGFCLGCAKKRIPVVVDGFIATAAALCAIKIHKNVKDYLFFGHVSDEQFHAFVLKELGVRPILSLNMRLGEGTGAVLATQIIEQALTCYHQMATFSSAGVSNRDS